MQPPPESHGSARSTAFSGLMVGIATVLYFVGSTGLLGFIRGAYPVPIILISLVHGTKPAALATVAVAVCTLLLTGPLAALHYLVPHGLKGILLCWSVRQNRSPGRALLVVGSLLGAALLLKFYVVLRVTGSMDALWIMEKGLATAIDLIFQLPWMGVKRALTLVPQESCLRWAVEGLEFLMGHEMRSTLAHHLVRPPIATFLVLGLIPCYFTHALCHLFLPRLGFEVAEPFRVSEFRIGYGSFGALAVATALLVRSRAEGAGPCGAIGANLIEAVGIGFLAVGGGVLERWGQRRGYSPAGRLVTLWIGALASPLLILLGFHRVLAGPVIEALAIRRGIKPR